MISLLSLGGSLFYPQPLNVALLTARELPSKKVSLAKDLLENG